MKKNKLIIVDFDGPINDLYKAKLKTINILADKLNIQFSDLAARSLLVYIDQIYENQRIIDYQTIIDQALTKLIENKMININHIQKKEFSESFTNTLHSNTVINIKFLSMLETLKNKKHIKLCIYSSQKKKAIQDLLGKHISIFDKVFANDDFDEPKPSIINLQLIAEMFLVSPGDVLMIGDNITVDLMPAKLLGMKTKLVTSFADTMLRGNKDLEAPLDF